MKVDTCRVGQTSLYSVSTLTVYQEAVFQLPWRCKTVKLFVQLLPHSYQLQTLTRVTVTHYYRDVLFLLYLYIFPSLRLSLIVNYS